MLATEDQKNGHVRIEHTPHPNGRERRPADVERARNMTATKGKHGSRVHKHASSFLDRLFESLRRKTPNAWKISKYFRSVRVYLFHDRIVLRHRRCAGQCVIGKTRYIVELQELIEFSLVTDRTAQTVPDVSAARRTGTVVRINHDVIGQLEIKITQGVKLFFRELFGVVRT